LNLNPNHEPYVEVSILRSLMDTMDAGQIRWLVAIILKDLKLGYGETPIMQHFHPDANDLYNVCCDLRRVCRELHTYNVPWKRQELQPVGAEQEA
jgi:DNA ligase-4